MDKKILSAAIIAVMAAPVAAVAETTLFGQVRMSVGAVEDTTVGAPLDGEDNMQVRSHESRLGVKGYEDLGGGLKANFMLEYGVNPDDNDPDGDGDDTSGFSRRNQWLGLSSDTWGEFRVGRHDLPLKIAQGSFDQFNDTDGDIKNIVLGEQRLDNVVAYLSPSFSGFSFIGAGLAGEADNCDEAGNEGGFGSPIDCPALDLGTPASDKTGLADAYSLAAMYSNGPIFASLAYNDYDATSGTGNLDQLLRGVATYQMGDFQVGGLYEMGERDGSNSDTEAWGLSGKYSFGAVDLKGQYMDGTYEQGVVGVPDEEATQWTLGVDYNFSKRTTAYFMYTEIEDELQAGGGVGDREFDFTGVGMVHKF